MVALLDSYKHSIGRESRVGKLFSKGWEDCEANESREIDRDSKNQICNYDGALEVGRFISPDPLGYDGGTMDLYSFVGGDPINYVDPTGLKNQKADADTVNSVSNGEPSIAEGKQIIADAIKSGYVSVFDIIKARPWLSPEVAGKYAVELNKQIQANATAQALGVTVVSADRDVNAIIASMDAKVKSNIQSVSISSENARLAEIAARAETGEDIAKGVKNTAQITGSGIVIILSGGTMTPIALAGTTYTAMDGVISLGHQAVGGSGDYKSEGLQAGFAGIDPLAMSKENAEATSYIIDAGFGLMQGEPVGSALTTINTINDVNTVVEGVGHIEDVLDQDD